MGGFSQSVWQPFETKYANQKSAPTEVDAPKNA